MLFLDSSRPCNRTLGTVLPAFSGSSPAKRNWLQNRLLRSSITSSHQRASLAAMLFSTSLLGNNDKIPPLQQSCRGTRRSGIFGIYSLYYTCILALATDLFRITANLQRTTIVYCLFLVTSFLISYIQRIALPSASDSSRSHIPRACVENSFCMNGK